MQNKCDSRELQQRSYSLGKSDWVWAWINSGCSSSSLWVSVNGSFCIPDTLWATNANYQSCTTQTRLILHLRATTSFLKTHFKILWGQSALFGEFFLISVGVFFLISTQILSKCEAVNKEKQQLTSRTEMEEKHWSLCVLADKSLLLWSVIWAIFPFKVGTEIHFAVISFETLHAGRQSFPTGQSESYFTPR